MIEHFVCFYDPVARCVKTGFVDARVLSEARLNLAMEHEIDADHPIDDELARRLGGAALLWLATQYPELREFLEISDGKGGTVAL